MTLVERALVNTEAPSRTRSQDNQFRKLPSRHPFIARYFGIQFGVSRTYPHFALAHGLLHSFLAGISYASPYGADRQ
jgi:hypothetical protein